MADRLGRGAERVSPPGEYRLHVRRLVALFAGLGVLEIGILSGPTVYFTEGVKPIMAALLLAPIVVLAVVIAGVAAGAINLRRCGSLGETCCVEPIGCWPAYSRRFSVPMLPLRVSLLRPGYCRLRHRATRWRGCTRYWGGTSSSPRRLLWY